MVKYSDHTFDVKCVQSKLGITGNYYSTGSSMCHICLKENCVN